MITVEEQNLEISEAWTLIHKGATEVEMLKVFGSREQLELSMNLFALGYKKGYMSVLNKVNKNGGMK